jgi:MEMO1 family protein
MTEYPKVRDGLEALPVEQAGRRMVLLRDRLGYQPNSLLIVPQLMGLLLHMNGTNSVRDLQEILLRASGELVHSEKLLELINHLDEFLFLENDRFFEVVAKELNAFREDPVRRMQFAGRSYPADPEILKAQLNDYVSEASSAAVGVDFSGRRLLGLVAPHIDISAGGKCFGHAYRAVAASDSPGTWVILATGHEPSRNHFALTVKDFETPLGLVRCDRDFCLRLMDQVPRDLRSSEVNHRREHTVEFQALFLAHVRPNCLIVPILCGFGLEEWESDGAYIDQVAGVLRDMAQLHVGSVGFIASVDLAHIGPRYGDHFRPHSDTVSEHLSADKRLLESLQTCDAEAFMEQIRRERNRRRVCGLAPLYLLARILEKQAVGVILDHRYATVDQQHSFVTFASMAFYQRHADAD